MDRASDSGSEGWGFESLPAYQTNIIRTRFSELEKGSDYLFILTLMSRHITVTVCPEKPDKRMSSYNFRCSCSFLFQFLLFPFPGFIFCLAFLRSKKGQNIIVDGAGQSFNSPIGIVCLIYKFVLPTHKKRPLSFCVVPYFSLEPSNLEGDLAPICKRKPRLISLGFLTEFTRCIIRLKHLV